MHVPLEMRAVLWLKLSDIAEFHDWDDWTRTIVALTIANSTTEPIVAPMTCLFSLMRTVRVRTCYARRILESFVGRIDDVARKCPRLGHSFLAWCQQNDCVDLIAPFSEDLRDEFVGFPSLQIHLIVVMSSLPELFEIECVRQLMRSEDVEAVRMLAAHLPDMFTRMFWGMDDVDELILGLGGAHGRR